MTHIVSEFIDDLLSVNSNRHQAFKDLFPCVSYCFEWWNAGSNNGDTSDLTFRFTPDVVRFVIDTY